MTDKGTLYTCGMRRTINGVTITNEGGSWHTEDNKYKILGVWGLSMCENGHPVRGSKFTAGSYCPGGESHEYFAGYRVEGPRIQEDIHSTLSGAHQHLADFLNQKAPASS